MELFFEEVMIKKNEQIGLKTTSESMIGAIVVVLNLIRLLKQHVYTLTENIFNKIKMVFLYLLYPKMFVGLVK
jgi:hypothetical protein